MLPAPLVLAASSTRKSTIPAELVIGPLGRLVPRRLDVLFHQAAVNACICNLAGQACLSDLLDEADAGRSALPVGDVLGLDLDQCHAGIFWAAGVHAVTQIAKPGIDTFAVDLLDTGIGVVGRGALASDADPVLGAGVLEGDLSGLVMFEIFELLRVDVGEVEEVGTHTFGNGHGTGNRTDVGANGGQQAALHAIDDAVELIELLILGSGFIPLRCNGRIGLGVNIFFGEWLRHIE